MPSILFVPTCVTIVLVFIHLYVVSDPRVLRRTVCVYVQRWDDSGVHFVSLWLCWLEYQSQEVLRVRSFRIIVELPIHRSLYSIHYFFGGCSLVLQIAFSPSYTCEREEYVTLPSRIYRIWGHCHYDYVSVQDIPSTYICKTNLM